MNKAKEYMLKVDQSNRTVNAYWQHVLSFRWNHGIDLSKGYADVVNSITPEDIQQMARQIKQGDRIAVVMSTPQ